MPCVSHPSSGGLLLLISFSAGSAPCIIEPLFPPPSPPPHILPPRHVMFLPSFDPSRMAPPPRAKEEAPSQEAMRTSIGNVDEPASPRGATKPAVRSDVCAT